MKSLDMSRWPAWAVLAACWAILPALPALLQGGFIGHGYTDLYPSVWGMWHFAEAQPGFPLHTDMLAAPEGMGFYYSSPLHGWMAWSLMPFIGVTGTWNGLLLLNRVAGVGLAFWAGKSWGLQKQGALVAAAVYGCSPFFHGYAVEGIAEGQISWALPLWLGFVGQEKHRWAGLAFALTIVGSWYMAASACFLAAMMPRRAWRSAAAGLVLASPAIYAFIHAFPARELLDPEIRQMMGTQIGTWSPGLSDGLNPFAKTSWIGFAAGALAISQARKHPRYLLAAGLFWLLSCGFAVTSDIPLLNSLRFPYRLHAATLVLLALLAGKAADQMGSGPLIAAVIVTEGLLLSPIEPLLPHAPTSQPAVYSNIEGESLLDIPGPIAMAPGLRNPSRPRARYFLYGQLSHGMASPWAPDFNGIGATGQEAPYLQQVRALDPHWPVTEIETLDIPNSVDFIVLHEAALGDRAERAHQLLSAGGWKIDFRDEEERTRYRR